MRKEDLLKLYQAYKLVIFPIIVTLCSLILIVFVIFPQAMKLLSNRTAEEEIQKKSEFLDAKAQTLETYTTSDLSLKVNSVLSVFPTDKDFATAVGLLQSLTAKSNFIINSLILGGSSEKDPQTQSYTIHLDLTGPLTSLQTLLNSLETSPRLMRVASVETTIKGDEKLAAVSLNVDILFSSPPGDFGKVDSPLPNLSQKDEEILSQLAKVTTPTQVVTPSQPTTPASKGRSNPFE